MKQDWQAETISRKTSQGFVPFFVQSGKDAAMRGIWLSEEHLEKLAREAGYKAKNLAKLRKVSSRQLQRDFRERFGASPQAWLDQLRIEAAANLLLSGDPIKQIAFDLGFKHTSHFCRKFKQFNRMTCSEFIRFQTTDISIRRSGITNVAQG